MSVTKTESINASGTIQNNHRIERVDIVKYKRSNTHCIETVSPELGGKDDNLNKVHREEKTDRSYTQTRGKQITTFLIIIAQTH